MAIGALAASLSASGCGPQEDVSADRTADETADTTEPASSISAEGAAERISEALAAEIGLPPDDVSCPHAIDAEVGNEMRCTLTDRGLTYGVTFRITEVDGDTAIYDVTVDPQPA